MIFQNKTQWEKDTLFKAKLNNKIYALAITAKHPIFNKVVEVFNDYLLTENPSNIIKTEEIATEEDIINIESKVKDLKAAIEKTENCGE